MADRTIMKTLLLLVLSMVAAKTAKVLDIEPPATPLARVDEVIEWMEECRLGHPNALARLGSVHGADYSGL